jgi:hypothetical protein
MRLFFTVPVLAALAYFYAASLLLPAAGYYHDDAIYIETAKSLAEGHGYRLLHLPEQPVQTKYPILLPALLAAMWRFAPDFPANVPLLKLAPFLAAVLWFWVSWRLLSKWSVDASLPIVLLVAASPVSIFFSTTVLAESLLALFATACLLWLEGSDVRSAAVAGLFAALAFHSKTIGALMVIAGIGTYLLRRQWRQCAVFGLVCLVLCLPWTAWQVVHARAGSVDTYNSLNNYYKDWSLLGRPVPEQLAVVGNNLVLIATSPMHFTGGSPRALTIVLCLVFAILGLFGMIADVQEHRLQARHLYCGLYLGTILVWPWPPLRFLWSILPFLVYFTYYGLARVWKHAPRAVLMMTAAALLAALPAQRYAGQQAGAPTLTSGPEQIRWSNFLQAMQAIRDRTGPNDRMLSILDPTVYLYTGRQAIRGFNADPVKLFYSDERKQALGDEAELEKLISTHGVTWILDTPPGHFSEGPVLSGLIQEYASKHRLTSLDVAPKFVLIRAGSLLLPAR